MNGDERMLVDRPASDVYDVVHDTCRRLYAVEDEFVGSFRASLDQLVPELRYTAPDGGAAIAEGLARAVLWAGLTTDPPDVVEVTFQNVGEEYGRRGFPSTGYHGAGHALLRAARDVQIAEWSSELSSAWVAYYGWLAAHLSAGAERAASEVRSGPGGDPRQPGPPSGPPPVAALPPAPLSAPPAPPPAPLLATSAPPMAVTPPAAGHGGFSGVFDVPALSAPATDQSSLDEVLHILTTRYFAGNERALGAILTRVALRTGADLRAPRPDQRTNPAVIANVVAVLQVMGYVLQPDAADAVQRVFSPPVRDPQPGRWWNRRRSPSVRNWRGSVP